MNKKIVGLLSVIVVLIIALFAVNTFLQKEVVDPTPSVIEDTTVVEEYVVTKDMFVVPNQAAGNEIFIERVELLTGGYVVIHRVDMVATTTESDEEVELEKPGMIIGVSEYLEAGVHENLVVTLSEGEETAVDERVIAMLHIESDLESTVHEFNAEEDMPSSADGEIVMSTFTILADDAPGFETKL